MTLLTMVQQASKRLNLSVPNTAIGATDETSIQLTALANEEGEELAARYLWTKLTKEATFVAVATESQGDLIGDILTTQDGFDYIINDTMWDRTRQLPIFGAKNAQYWQAVKAVPSTGPLTQFRLRGGELLFWPVGASSGSTVAFEYKTKNWCVDSTGVTGRSAWAADTDLGVLDEQLMVAGICWRWKQVKGHEYAEDYNKYERRVADAISRESVQTNLSLNGPMSSVYGPVIVIPAGSWNI